MRKTSIKTRVAEALRRLLEKDYESAMIAACIALDATARKMLPDLAKNKYTGKRCTEFINANQDIIISVGFGGALVAAPGGKVRLKTPGSPGSLTELERIIYETLRCTLLHEASLPPNVVLTEDVFYGERDGLFHIPVAMIYGLLAAIIGSPWNSNCFLPGDGQIRVPAADLAVNDFWGKAHVIRERLGLGGLQGSR